MFDLVVVSAFRDFAIGDMITDDAEIDAALEANQRCVVRVSRPKEVVKPPQMKQQQAKVEEAPTKEAKKD